MSRTEIAIDLLIAEINERIKLLPKYTDEFVVEDLFNPNAWATLLDHNKPNFGAWFEEQVIAGKINCTEKFDANGYKAKSPNGQQIYIKN